MVVHLLGNHELSRYRLIKPKIIYQLNQNSFRSKFTFTWEKIVLSIFNGSSVECDVNGTGAHGEMDISKSRSPTRHFFLCISVGFEGYVFRMTLYRSTMMSTGHFSILVRFVCHTHFGVVSLHSIDGVFILIHISFTIFFLCSFFFFTSFDKKEKEDCIQLQNLCYIKAIASNNKNTDAYIRIPHLEKKKRKEKEGLEKR